MNTRLILIILILLSNKSLINAQDAKWDFEIFSGVVYNFPSPLKISQNNEKDIKIWADYRTEPFKLPPYYDIRVTRIKGDKGWDLEFFHHKIILNNTQPGLIDQFSVTHGYNIVTIKRVLLKKGFVYHYGGGFVITHPENIIRGKSLDQSKGIGGEGYYFSGLVIEGAVDKRFYFTKYFYASVESKLTASKSRVPVAEGRANITLLTIHAIVGLGIEL